MFMQSCGRQRYAPTLVALAPPRPAICTDSSVPISASPTR